MNLEYVIVKICPRKPLGKVHASNKMASQMNVSTDNVTSQCFYVIYSYSFNVSKKFEVIL